MANRWTELVFANKNISIKISNNRLTEDGDNSKLFLLVDFKCGDTMFFVQKYFMEKEDDEDKEQIYCTYIKSIDDEIMSEIIKIYFTEPDNSTTLFITISCGTTKYDKSPAEILKGKPEGYILNPHDKIYNYYEIPKLTCVADLVTRMAPFERMFFVY